MDFWQWVFSSNNKLLLLVLVICTTCACTTSLQVENSGDSGDGSTPVICNSLAIQPPDPRFVKFLCFCRDRLDSSEFSLADFLMNISPFIKDKLVNITFKHCWSMRIYFDLVDLYQYKDDKIQPNLFIQELLLENIVEASLERASFGIINDQNDNQSSSSKLDAAEMKAMSNTTVTLSGVSRIQLQADLPVQAVEALDTSTMVFVDLLNQTESEIMLRGFESGNIMVAGGQSPTSQINEFQHVLATIENNISARSNILSMVLIGCACIVAIGLIAALGAVFKRNQYLIQAVVYSSIGSLRRGAQNKNLAINNSDKSDVDSITTTTQISFFPKYSVKEVSSVRNSVKGGSSVREVNSVRNTLKSEKGVVTGVVSSARSSVKSHRSHKQKDESKKDHATRAKRSKSVPAKKRQSKAEFDESTALGINLSMRIKSLSRLAKLGTIRVKKPPPPPPSISDREVTGVDVETGLHRNSSFYYQPPSDTSASSKSDLTGRRHLHVTTAAPARSIAAAVRSSAVPVTVQVHSQPDDIPSVSSGSDPDISIPYPDSPGGNSTRVKVENLLRNQSPQPLIGVERKYSFIDIREKCRQMIKFHLNSNNTKL